MIFQIVQDAERINVKLGLLFIKLLLIILCYKLSTKLKSKNNLLKESPVNINELMCYKIV